MGCQQNDSLADGAGDIRGNLDPLGEAADDVLLAALAEVSLTDVVAESGWLDKL